MGYNHAKEEKKFYEEWRKKLRQYKAAGMSMKQILVLYKFDKAVLRSDRRYFRHCVAFECNDKDEEYAVLPDFDTYNADNWIDVLPPRLRKRLTKLPELHLKAFYLYRVCGFTQDEISVILGKPQRTISYWIGKVAEILTE